MAVRAVAVDIDGTVTDYERLIDWSGVAALRQAEAKAVPVIVASGNVGPVSKAFASFVGLSGPLVAENGGVVYSNDMRQRRILSDRAPALAGYRRLLEAGLPARPIWSDAYRLSEVALDLNLDEAEARRILNGTGLEIVATRFALHLMEPGFDKFKGIREALAWIDPQRPPTPAEVLAIGDSNNDVTMLRGCGASGCVANGSEGARAAAKYVARGAHGEGVAEILRHYDVI